MAVTRRIEPLTGVRLLAAAAVFLFHVGAPPGAPRPVAAVVGNGYDGVTIFFVLSGFVLAWSYAESLAHPSWAGIRTFAVARLARIYPLYLAALLLAMVVAVGRGEGVPSWTWLHVLALQTWSPDIDVAFGLNGPGWSIGVEVFLYACFPLLVVAMVAATRRSPRALPAFLVGAVALAVGLAAVLQAAGVPALPMSDPGSTHRWLYRTPLTRLGDFAAGMAVALLARAWGQRAAAGRSAQVVGVLAVVGLMATPALSQTTWSWDAAYVLPVVLVVGGLALAPRTLAARLLGSRAMVAGGEASYAFYLLHAPLLALMAAWTTSHWVVDVAGKFAVVLVAALLTHRFLERPCRRAIRARLDPLRAPAAPIEVAALGQGPATP